MRLYNKCRASPHQLNVEIIEKQISNASVFTFLSYICGKLHARYEDFYLIGYEDRCEGSEAESVNFSTKILEKEQWYVLHEYDEEYDEEYEDEDEIGDPDLDYSQRIYNAKFHIDLDSLIPLRFLTDTTSLYRIGDPVERLKDTVHVKRRR